MLLVESVVQSAQSVEQELSLVLVDVLECFDGLGSFGGTLLDRFGGAEELAAILVSFSTKTFLKAFLDYDSPLSALRPTASSAV